MFVPAGTDRTLGCHAGNINPTRVYELCLCSTTVMGPDPDWFWIVSKHARRAVGGSIAAEEGRRQGCQRFVPKTARWLGTMGCRCNDARAEQRSTLARGLSWLHLQRARRKYVCDFALSMLSEVRNTHQWIAYGNLC